jgi:hypothetical protein
MSRLAAINPDDAAGMTKELFDAIKERMGMVPNMMSAGVTEHIHQLYC